MRSFISLLLVAAVLAALALGGSGSAGAATPTVRVGDNFFSPKSIRVSKGRTVRFKWVGDNPHNVTGGGRASRTTSRTGYVYKRRFFRRTRLICTVHPTEMRMTVRIR
jgi:plastocyanin